MCVRNQTVSKPSTVGSAAAQITDKYYGLTGLLQVIRMTDPDLNTVALGTDLTTLGLTLNSSEYGDATFCFFQRVAWS